MMIIATGLIVVVGALSTLAFVRGCSPAPKTTTKPVTINDNATGDTPVETLKTLTAQISTVEQQNQKLVERNKTLEEQDKTTLSQFKTDVLAQVQQQLGNFKTQQPVTPVALPAHDQSEVKNQTTVDAAGNPINATGFVWVSDLQQPALSINSGSDQKDKSAAELAELLNPGGGNKIKQQKETPSLISPTKTTTAEVTGGYSGEDVYSKPDRVKKTIPYYTIPVNATLTGAIAMQPLIGRVPIDGKVPDPYTFKAVIGPKNLAANGIDIPSDIQGIVVSGVAEGDMLGGCTRGEITSMTFVFSDGRISTTQSKASEALGTIAAANGNPCIAGSFHSDAAIFLGATAGLAGIQGYGNALSQSQLSTSTSSATGATISTLLGNANKYAFGQGVSASSQAAQTWWNQRVQNSFDFIYVPNVDLRTGKKLELNINVTQEIPIDYDPQGRKVFYDHTNNHYAEKMD